MIDKPMLRSVRGLMLAGLLAGIAAPAFALPPGYVTLGDGLPHTVVPTVSIDASGNQTGTPASPLVTSGGGSTGHDYSANAPTLPVVAASTFGGSTSMSAWVLLSTIPASLTRAGGKCDAIGGQTVAIIEDDGTSANGSAPVNATLDILAGGTGLYSQGGVTIFDADKSRFQFYGPTGTVLSCRIY